MKMNILAKIIVLLFIIFNAKSLNIINKKFEKRDVKNFIEKEKIQSDETYKIIKNNLKYFNSELSDYELEVIYKTIKFYSMDTNYNHLKLYCSQLMLESGVRHEKNGNIIKSNTGAIGIAQITGTTGYYFLLRKITPNDSILLEKINVTDFSFVYSKELNKNEKIRLVRKWLEKYENNIFMWGLINHHNFKMVNDIYKSLLIYNIGYSGMKRYIQENSMYNHEYIMLILKNVEIYC
jgi:hypothetical protein